MEGGASHDAEMCSGWWNSNKKIIATETQKNTVYQLAKVVSLSTCLFPSHSRLSAQLLVRCSLSIPRHAAGRQNLKRLGLSTREPQVFGRC